MPRKNSLICTPLLYLEHCICVYYRKEGVKCSGSAIYYCVSLMEMPLQHHVSFIKPVVFQSFHLDLAMRCTFDPRFWKHNFNTRKSLQSTIETQWYHGLKVTAQAQVSNTPPRKCQKSVFFILAHFLGEMRKKLSNFNPEINFHSFLN